MNRIGRRTAVCMLAIALFAALWSIAHAQQITLGGIARSYSASYFVRTVCPKFFKVNDAFATKHGGSLLEFGAVKFGKPEIKNAVIVEVDRRRGEVTATGESAWCSYQRASMMADGLNDLFR
jgi:hypothetical protein